LLFEKIQKTFTANFSGSAKAKAIALKWNKSTDPQFFEFVANRYNSLADANSNTNSTEVYRGVERKCLDNDDLVISSTYHYRLFYYDIYGNPSGFSGIVSIQYTGFASHDIVGEISGDQIADGAIGTNHIDIGAITAEKIADEAIVAEKIKDGTIQATKFAAGLSVPQVVSALPATGTTGQLVVLTTDGKLYRYNGTTWTAAVAAGDVSGQLTDSQIAGLAATKLTGQIVANQIQDGVISAAKMASGLSIIERVSTLPSTGNFTGRIAFLTTDNKLYRYNGTAWTSAVPTADLSGQITDAQIAGLGASKIAGTIVGTQIADGAITTAKMTANTIDGNVIAANTLNASKIVAGSITTDRMTANSINGDRIAANTLGADKIIANSITAAQIATGAITADELAANSVTAKHLILTDFSNIVDAGWSQGIIDGWTLQNKLNFYQDVSSGQGVAGGWYLQSNGRDQANSLWISANPGDVFFFDVWVFNQDASRANVMLHTTTPDGATHLWTVAAFTDSKAGWTNLVGQATVPAGHTRASMLLQTDRTTGGTGSNTYWSRPIMRRANTAELIVDGSITTNSMAANSINGDRISANTLNASKLVAGSITTDRFTANSIGGTIIQDGTLNADKIVANSITAAHIAAGAIGTSELAVGNSANQIVNSDFATGNLTNWFASGTSNAAYFTLSFRTDTYAPAPGALEIRQINGTASQYYDVSPTDANGAQQYYNVAANKWYELSCYFNGHRCNNIALYIQWFDSNGTHISYSLVASPSANINTNPAKMLSNYTRAWGKAQAPSNAARCRVFFRHNGTVAGQADSYLWIYKAFFGEANANQTEATPWSPAGLTLIGNGNIATDAITADKINVTNLAAISATLGNVDISNANIGTLTIGSANLGNGAVNFSKTDPTLPAALQVAPFGAQTATDVDLDGKTDIAIKWTWNLTNVTQTTNTIVGYQCTILEAGTKIDSFYTTDQTVTRKVKTGKAYILQVQTVGFNGKMSNAVNSNSVTPTKKAAVVNGTFVVSNFTVTQRDYSAWLECTRCTEPDYLETRFYRYATLADANADTNRKDLGSYYANTYFDEDDALTIGSSYWYRIQHFDRFRNPGPLSAVQSVTIVGPKHKDLIVRNTQNLIEDFDCEDVSQWIVSNAGTALVRSVNTTNLGSGKYKIQTTGIQAEIRSVVIPLPATAGMRRYRLSCYAGPIDGSTATIKIFGTVWGRDANGNPSSLGLDVNSASITVNTPTYIETIIAVPAGFDMVKMTVETTDATSKTWAIMSPSIVPIVDTTDIYDLAVTRAKIDDLAVNAAKMANSTIVPAKIANDSLTVVLDAADNTTLALTNGVATVANSIASGTSADTDVVHVLGSFKNVSGAAKNFDVSLELGDGTLLRSWPGIVLQDNDVRPFLTYHRPTAANHVYRLMVTANGTGCSISRRVIEVTRNER